MRDHSRAFVLGGILSAAGCRDAPPAAVPDTQPPGDATATVPASNRQPASAPGATAASARSDAAFRGPWRLTFDGDAPNAAPKGMAFGTTGKAKAGRWIVRPEEGAPSAQNALVQVDADDTDYRFPVAVADAPVLKDVRVSVRCKPISGKVDQACGLVLRYQNANNYVITRANALEGNVRLYVVKDGVRKQLASWSGAVRGGVWHEYRIEARGDHFEVTWDSTKVLDHHDGTFATAGKVGVWTKADSVTAFDDLTMEAL